MKASTKDPLAPFAFVITFLGAFTVFVWAGVVPLGLLLDDGSVGPFGLGDPHVCVSSSFNGVPVTGTGPGVEGLAKGVHADSDGLLLCHSDAPAAAQWQDSAFQLLPFGFFLGFLLLSWRIVRPGYRQGLFVPAVAGRVTALGWYLVAGSLLVAVAQAFLQIRLAERFLPVGAHQWTAHFDLPGAVLVAGICVLSVGRVIARAALIQREVDTLV